ncbi:PREDICTED: coenzyme Q-binding protein COQ10 homolog B, mitochondrial-like isoform X2 [Priapulus caudatus]|nr:PREDICTED: coenzyme Q-binding protein COQ10 homolog B, mitochondrial-like isoform X2 [Priapulus caudatus]
MRASSRFLCRDAASSLLLAHEPRPPPQRPLSRIPATSQRGSTPPPPSLCPRRHFFKLPSLPFGGKRKDYSEQRILGYSMQQMYNVVADVDKYPEFVPWCTDATIANRTSRHFNCMMEIGFHPLIERYNSVVTVVPPNLVRSVCTDGMLFNHLETTWRFSPGIRGNDSSCRLEFSLSFEFRSVLHSHLSSVFFNEVVKTMVRSFLRRARALYGEASIVDHRRPTVVSRS